MRAHLRPFVHHLRWPVRIAAFVAHFMHHLAAFFAWIWMLGHVTGSVATAGIQAGRLWEMKVIEEIWKGGMQYFSLAGGVGWQKIVGLALIPAYLLAFRNAYRAYEQLRAWVHDHKATRHAA
jgi:hypothetical protein